MEEILKVTDFILSKHLYTPKQVQKLLFYSYSLYLIKYNEKYSDDMKKLFKGDFEARKHGPVNIQVYEYLKKQPNVKEQVILQDKKHENFIDKILLVFGRYSGLELEEMLKKEMPWIKAYTIKENTKISDEDIYEYYSKYKK
ncbi:MAG: DUF4065 domain-containing protein [Clostridia bacterium]|nr:DUF4065 domain-containing protein [Clostridia bacterium]MBP3681623.1 DUF4065 domain-containing protein [Clostridia bacterium]